MTKYFSNDENYPRRKFSPTKIFPDEVFPDKVVDSFEIGTSYDYLVEVITNHFEPTTTTTYEIWNFQKTTQPSDETCQAYFIRLKDMSSQCNFPDVNRERYFNERETLRRYIIRNKTSEFTRHREQRVSSRKHSSSSTGNKRIKVKSK